MNKIQYQARANREKEAGNLAKEILEVNDMLQAPVDPLAFVKLEAPRLRVRSGNFGSQCDGQLEYHRDSDTFLLFYNNKYDCGLADGQHHPRTRFSIAHELGHFYIEHHRFALMKGVQPHSSKNEFSSEVIIEREADSFAAGLLMPTPIFRPMVNQGELSIDRIREISVHFRTSWVSTAIRSVQHSDFPCEVVGIRDGSIVWRFRPEGNRDPLIEGGCYPLPRGMSSWVSKGLVQTPWPPREDLHGLGALSSCTRNGDTSCPFDGVRRGTFPLKRVISTTARRKPPDRAAFLFAVLTNSLRVLR